MNWITVLLGRYERPVAIVSGFLIITLNLGSLYFIIDLLSYDEMVGYLSDGDLRPPIYMALFMFY